MVAPSASAVDTEELIANSAAALGDCPGEAQRDDRFLDWGDRGSYFLAPGGDFDIAGPRWTLRGGAALQSGYSPVASGVSLTLPRGATALSPPICVAEGYTHGRMFGQAEVTDRRPRADAEVGVLFSSGEVDRSEIRMRSGWDATRTFRFDEREYRLDPITHTDTIRLLFTGKGPARAILDGVYIDPMHRH